MNTHSYALLVSLPLLGSKSELYVKQSQVQKLRQVELSFRQTSSVEILLLDLDTLSNINFNFRYKNWTYQAYQFYFSKFIVTNKYDKILFLSFLVYVHQVCSYHNLLSLEIQIL